MPSFLEKLEGTQQQLELSIDNLICDTIVLSTVNPIKRDHTMRCLLIWKENQVELSGCRDKNTNVNTG
jgi:hypothetical protein